MVTSTNDTTSPPMTSDEEGYRSVESCIAALTTSEIRRGFFYFNVRTFLDTQVAKAAHPYHFRGIHEQPISRSDYLGRLCVSSALLQVLLNCEDLDQLLSALIAYKRLTNNYQDIK